MNEPNGAPNVPQASPSIQIGIIWTPSSGSLQVMWPAVDDTIKLGMLEMAKVVLLEARNQQQNKGRIMPASAIPNLRGN